MTGALFLDRDGVINVDRHYVHRIADFEFIDGVFETARLARSLGLSIFVVTNQAGIGRGLYAWSDFEVLTRWMEEQFAARGAPLTAVYACPFHADARPPYDVADHPDRKPNPGMLLRAVREHGIAPEQSVLLGDRETDIEAGLRAGVASTALFGAADAGKPTRASVRVRDHAEAQAWLMSCARR